MTTATKTPLMAKFAQVYADAVTEYSQSNSDANMRKRELQWTHDQRVPLQEAADAYAQIMEGYNEFRPNMIADLLAEVQTAMDLSPDCAITATVARAYSVCIYLHVPDKQGLRKRVEAFVRAYFNADEIDWKDADSKDDPGTLRVWWD